MGPRAVPSLPQAAPQTSRRRQSRGSPPLPRLCARPQAPHHPTPARPSQPLHHRPHPAPCRLQGLDHDPSARPAPPCRNLPSPPGDPPHPRGGRCLPPLRGRFPPAFLHLPDHRPRPRPVCDRTLPHRRSRRSDRAVRPLGHRRFCYRSCPKRQGKRSPDLSRASGFRLYSMLVDAAVEGMGTAIGHPAVIAREMQRGAVVPVFDRQVEAPARCCLITTADSRRNAGVQAFREGRRAGNRRGKGPRLWPY